MQKDFDDFEKKENNNFEKEDFSMNLNEEELKKLSELVKTSILDELLKLSDDELNEINNFEFQEENKNKNKNVEEEFYKHNSLKECAVCGSEIKDFGHYSIEFGENIRKKANFCGLDCLSEFIEELKYAKGLKQKK